MKRTLRHPIRGDRLHPKPSTRPARRSSWRTDARQPRMRPRKSVNVVLDRRLSRGGGVAARTCGCASSASVVLLLFGVLVLRLWTLQVVEGKSYAAAVTRNQVRVVSVAAPRGAIADRNGTVLVTNQPQQEILLSRAEAAQNPCIVGMVAALVGQTPAAGAGVRQQQPVQPLRAGAGGHRRLGRHRAVPPDPPVGVPRRERADRGPAHLPPGRDHGHADPRVRRATSPRATWPPTRTTGYTQGSQVGRLGHRGPVRALPAGGGGPPGPLGRRQRRRGGDAEARRRPRSATPWCSTSTPACSRRSRTTCSSRS